MADSNEKPKLGAGALKAALRQGHAELAQALPAFPDSNVKPVEVMGALGSPTPQQVFAEQQPDPAAEYDKRLAAEADQAPGPRQRDRGMSM